MAKTNFTKVEEALDKGIQQVTVNKLLTEADEAQGKKAPALPPEQLARLNMRLALRQDLKWLRKQDKEVYSKLGIPKETVKSLLKMDPKTLTDEDWKTLTDLQAKATELKHQMDEAKGNPSDDAIIEKERHKHINKRFNVKEKWLPLK